MNADSSATLAIPADRIQIAQVVVTLVQDALEVMKLLLGGKASKEIAAALRVSVRTVEGPRRMMSEIQVSSAAQSCEWRWAPARPRLALRRGARRDGDPRPSA